MNKEKKQNIINALKNGKSYDFISKEYNTSKTTISKIKKEITNDPDKISKIQKKPINTNPELNSLINSLITTNDIKLLLNIWKYLELKQHTKKETRNKFLNFIIKIKPEE